jgi:hypothetical protein
MDAGVCMAYYLASMQHRLSAYHRGMWTVAWSYYVLSGSLCTVWPSAFLAGRCMLVSHSRTWSCMACVTARLGSLSGRWWFVWAKKQLLHDPRIARVGRCKFFVVFTAASAHVRPTVVGRTYGRLIVNLSVTVTMLLRRAPTLDAVVAAAKENDGATTTTPPTGRKRAGDGTPFGAAKRGPPLTRSLSVARTTSASQLLIVPSPVRAASPTSSRRLGGPKARRVQVLQDDDDACDTSGATATPPPCVIATAAPAPAPLFDADGFLREDQLEADPTAAGRVWADAQRWCTAWAQALPSSVHAARWRAVLHVDSVRAELGVLAKFKVRPAGRSAPRVADGRCGSVHTARAVRAGRWTAHLSIWGVVRRGPGHAPARHATHVPDPRPLSQRPLRPVATGG